MTDQSVIVNRTGPGRFSHRRYRNLPIADALISASRWFFSGRASGSSMS
jgi:hypothetical protein